MSCKSEKADERLAIGANRWGKTYAAFYEMLVRSGVSREKAIEIVDKLRGRED